MNNNLMNFEGHNVEIFEWNGQVLFNPKHVAECLGLSDVTVRRHIQGMNEKQVIKLTNLDVQNVNIRKLNNAGENFLTESGVYKLIFKSHKEEAERFQDWVTDEVLPSIRKHGVYMTDNILEKSIADPDYMIGILTALKEEKILREKAQKEKAIAIEEKKDAEKKRDLLIHTGKTYTTSEIAKELGINSAQKLNQILHIKKIQYKRNNTWIPYAKYAALGYTSTKQMMNDHGIIVYNTKWTGKGRDFILNLFNNKEKENHEDLSNEL